MMFFRRRGFIRKEFNQRLINRIDVVKSDWYNQKLLVEKAFDPSMDLVCQAKLAEAKYFFLFKEAKLRKITVSR